MDCRFVVRPLRGESLDFSADLTQQLACDAGVIDSVFGQAMRDDETALVHSYVQFPPISRAFRSMLGRSPSGIG